MMSNKPKFDLSNVGGRPKDWMQKEHEKRLEPGLGLKEWFLIATLLVSGVVVLYGLIQFALWVLR
jgi:hypothetical protein